MYKKDFINIAQAAITETIGTRFKRGVISKEDTDLVIRCIFEVITRTIEAGDEVRYLPYGRFYPKTRFNKKSNSTTAKLGFTSYKRLDKMLTESLDLSSL